MTGEFKISVLASGSKGNATIITAGGKNFLIDAGISCRQLTQRIKETGMQPEDLDGVLLTHEHPATISAACRYSAVNTTCRCLPTSQPGAVCRSAAKWNAAAAVCCQSAWKQKG